MFKDFGTKDWNGYDLAYPDELTYLLENDEGGVAIEVVERYLHLKSLYGEHTFYTDVFNCADCGNAKGDEFFLYATDTINLITYRSD